MQMDSTQPYFLFSDNLKFGRIKLSVLAKREERYMNDITLKMEESIQEQDTKKCRLKRSWIHAPRDINYHQYWQHSF